MNSSSRTILLSAGYTQTLSAYAPFSLTINPASIPVNNKVYKVSYDFGDGSTHDQLLDITKGSPLQFPQTHQYFLTGSFVKNIEVNVNVYTFNTSSDINYKIYLNLQSKQLEQTDNIVYYPTDSLLAYWSMKETTGNILDSSPNGYDLVRNGTVESKKGKIGNAAFFNGGNYSYLTNNDITIPNSNDFTIVGWFKPTARGFVEIINQWQGGYNGNFVITYDESNNASLKFYVRTTTAQSTDTIPISLNEWTFFVMRWINGVALNVKINNSSWKTVANTGNLLGKGTTRFLVGAGETSGTYTINGGVDEIGIWTRALSDSEIDRIYDTVANGFSVKELHLVGSRMFGPNDDILYYFESIEPSYILPVLVNWDEKPAPPVQIAIPPDYRPFKLLAPFENEAVTSIDNGSHVYSMPDGEGKYLPDTGSINQIKVYDGNSVASKFFATIDNNWSNIENWKTDGGNISLYFPTTSVNVTVFAPIENISNGTGYARNINFNQDTFLKNSTLVIQESAIFRSNSYNLGSISGNAYFLNNSYNQGYEPTLLLLNGEGADGSRTFTDSSTYNRILTYTGNPVITSFPVTPNDIVNDGLVFQVDAEGYTGDGTKWMDTITGVSAIAQNSPTYVANSPSYFDFNGASQCFNFPPVAFCSVLMHFNNINGSTTFTDSSDNNLTFNQNVGSPIISTSQYEFGGSSLYLDGSSCIATANNGLFTFATKDMTYEAWVYLTAYPTTDNWNYQWYNTFVVMGVGTPNGGDGFNLNLGTTKIFCQSNDQMLAIGTHNMSLNTWYHVAAVVKSGVLKIYVDGNLTGSQAVGSLGGGSVFSIGSETRQGAYFKGYIDEVRVYNGYAAYTSDFTPPTSELTKDVPTQINVNLNNNFTLETWVNVRGNNEWGGIISLATGGYENFGRGYGEQYSLNTTGGQYFRFDVNTGSYLNGIRYTLNNWTHIITTFESGVVKTYKNGLLADTQTIASTANTIIDAYLALGVNQYGGFEYLNGKIATARIYNKALSSYEALQNFNATKERFGMNRGSFMYFDGSSSLTPVSGGNDFAFGKEDFTIEAWIYPTRDNGTSQVFYDTRIGGYSPYPVIYLQYGTYLTFYNGSGNVITGDRVGLYDWTHVAVSRKNGKVRLFLNGVQTGGTANDTNDYKSNTTKPIIGGSFDNYNFKGFIEDFRVTKGIAKYTGSYTVPTSSLELDPYITGDVTGTAFFRDNSINYGTLTNAVFSGNSQNFGTVTNADVWYPVIYPLSGNYTNINYYGYPPLYL